MDKSLQLKPRLSEKTYAVAQATNTYVVDVPKGANKHTIARAVAAQFDVTVTNVNVANISGKRKRTVQKRGRATAGKQNDTRKAYVTLKAGDTLPFFAAIEESEAKSEKITEATKKALDKKAKKESK